MTRSVARHVDDGKMQSQGIDDIVLAQRLKGFGNAFVGRTHHARTRGCAQLRNATDMIGVVVGD